MLGNNLPLHELPGFEATAHQPFPIPGMGMVGDIHVDSLLMSWAVMAIILLGALMVRPTLTATGPGNAGQALSEMVYDFTAGITKEQIHDHWRKFFPLVAAIFMFVLMANFSGILPWEAIAEGIKHATGFWPMEPGEPHKLFEVAAPSTDFNITFGLAVVALVTYLGSGFWAHGGNYLKLYLNPIEWMDLIIRPATLSIRLMMVITADEILRAAAITMVPMLLPTGVMAFEMGIALIQAFVFALLTSIYIGLTVSHH